MVTTVRRLTPPLLLGVVGNSVLYLVPLLVGAMVTDRGFTEAQAGYLASADLWGYAVSTLLTAFLLGRYQARDIAMFGAVMMILANVGTTGIHGLAPFAAIRFASGFGGGLLVAISTVVLGREEKPDRNFGLFYAASLLFATAAFWVLPPVIEVFRLNSVYWLLVLLAVLACFGARALPEHVVPRHGSGANLGRKRWLPAGTMLVAVVVFLAQQGALWAYLERIGNHWGLSGVFIGFSLGVSTLTGFAGASLVVWAGNRFDRFMPLLVTTVVQVVALAALVGQQGAATFLIVSSVLTLCWNIVNPLQLGILAGLDTTGRALALAATATGVGMALGPSIGALTLDGEGYSLLLSTVGILTIVSFGLMALVLRTPAPREQIDLA